MATRSELGRGEEVGIYLVDKDWGDSSLGGNGRTTIIGSTGEDFAECNWPVVVKVKADVTNKELCVYLEDLLEAVREGFFLEVGAEQRGNV